MNTDLKSVLIRREKSEMTQFLTEHPEFFDEAMKIALSTEQPFCWRAAWMIGGCMEKNDPRITPYISEIIETLSELEDGHLRELLKILLNMELNEEQESLLFDFSVSLWEQVLRIPSVRHFAFKSMIRIAEKYPELNHEILVLTQPHYVNPLSPGIRHGVLKTVRELEKKTS